MGRGRWAPDWGMAAVRPTTDTVREGRTRFAPVGRRGGGSAAAIPPSCVRPLVLLVCHRRILTRRPGVWLPVDGNGRRLHLPRVRPRPPTSLPSASPRWRAEPGGPDAPSRPPACDGNDKSRELEAGGRNYGVGFEGHRRSSEGSAPPSHGIRPHPHDLVASTPLPSQIFDHCLRRRPRPPNADRPPARADGVTKSSVGRHLMPPCGCSSCRSPTKIGTH